MPDLVQYHISRLKDKSPEVRVKAAHELGLLGDPAALDALQELFRTETDPRVMKAAQDAGRAIYQKQKEQKEND